MQEVGRKGIAHFMGDSRGEAAQEGEMLDTLGLAFEPLALAISW